MTSRLTDALKKAGAVLKRHRKHLVYELPDGQNFVVASTPSDPRAERNALSHLSLKTGDQKSAKPNTPPREKRDKPGRARAAWTVKAQTMAAKLREVGVVERAQTQTITALEQAIVERDHTIAALLEAQQCLTTTRWHRLGRWLGVA